MAGARAWGLFAAVSVLWGVPYLFIGVALRSGFGPVSLAAARVVLAALVLAPFGLRRARRELLRGRGGRLAVLAVVEVVVPFVLIPVGEQTVASGTAAVVIATEPLFVLVTGLVLGTRARPGTAAVIGLLVGLGGVAVLSGVAGGGIGVVPLVAAAACYAVGAVLISHWFGDVPALGVAAAMLAIAAPLLVVATLVLEPLPTPTLAGLAAIGALGVGATAVGFVAFFALVATSGPDHAALITYAAPVVAVACGALLLHEPLGPRTLLGTALVFAGAWLATRPRPAQPPSRE
ncbi:membrane protein [Pseudonocardia sulfidoxydans NBRC 16205]|uniref:Membrane protein n=1 Tax=Pseudonocardia sulfidoxydans NBRC 16205 TaxID=1223511 RepID=A0A511DKG2_9PSEU|nr:DMT family transporter [Pseudonocardia sulfidoxydans]GEL25310.1 membrane protein [Pseudonocardia sulfidoxydans NBRC 16205]